MAGRAYWKGFLKLSLVACPVKLYSATSTAASRVSFNMIHKDTLNRVTQRYHDPELGEVERADLVKGYQFEKDKYVIVTAEELDAIEIESSKTIDIDGFVDAADIDPIYLDTPYYLAPADEVSEEAFAVIREALADKKMAGMARLVLYNRERPVVIEPREPGMLLTTLRFDRLVRKPDEIFDGIDRVKIDAEMTDIATHIIDRKRMKFDPSQFEDKYEDALLELIKAKKAGRKLPKAEPAERSSNVISLFDALKKSLAEEGGSGRKGSKPSTKRKPAARSRPASHRRSSAKSRHRKSA
jgi:DNA end-binding protein Ku